MVSARVTLKGAKTYTLNGQRFIQDVPKIIKGEEETILPFEQNGYFHVSRLKAKAVEQEKKVKAMESEEDDEIEEQETKSAKKKGLLKK